jgi:pilus assembly protein Flp/PilA
MRQTLHRLVAVVRDTRAATAIEYGLIAALIAVAATVAMGGLGNQVKSTFKNVSTKMAVTPTA